MSIKRTNYVSKWDDYKFKGKWKKPKKMASSKQLELMSKLGLYNDQYTTAKMAYDAINKALTNVKS